LDVCGSSAASIAARVTVVPSPGAAVAAILAYLGDLCGSTNPRELGNGDRLPSRSDLHSAAQRDITRMVVVFAGVR
jgi:hypothetical protein